MMFNAFMQKHEPIVFNFNEIKATQVAALLLSLNNNELNYTKLIKLLYIIEKISLERFNCPVIGDEYYSLPKGPIVSRILNIIKNDWTYEGDGNYWNIYLSKNNKILQLKGNPGTNELSKRETKLIIEIDEKFKKHSFGDMIDYCHLKELFPEWEDPKRLNLKRLEIDIEKLLLKMRKSEIEIQMIRNETKLEHLIQQTF